MSTVVEGPRRVHALDGLRACAILPVLITHFWTYPAGYEALNRLARSGWMGVDLFFVLSGFLITGILWDERHSARYYRNFYMRRALRIFPLYYLLLALVFFVLATWHPTPALLAARRGWPLYTVYLANVALVLSGWQVFALDITWSLAVEEQFYLCWPWGVRHFSRHALIAALVALVLLGPLLRAAALVGFGAKPTVTHMLTVFRLDGFAAGGLLALALKESLVPLPCLRRWARAGFLLLGPVLLGLVVSGRFDRDSLLVGTVGYTLLALFFTSVLVVAISSGRFARLVLETPALCRIGLVSYGIYILHPLTYMAVSTICDHLGVPLRALVPSALGSGVLSIVVTAACAYGVAELSYRYFERPLLRLKDRFRGSPPPPQAAHEVMKHQKLLKHHHAFALAPKLPE